MAAKKPIKKTVAKPVKKTTTPKKNNDVIDPMNPFKKTGGAKAVKEQMERNKAWKTKEIKGGFLGMQTLGKINYDSRYVDANGKLTALGKQTVAKSKKKK